MTAIAQDAFGRTVASGSGWTTADLGGSWTHSSLTAIGVDGAKGFYTGTASKLNHLGSVTNIDLDITFTWSIAALPPAAGTYSFWGIARLLDANNYYRLGLVVTDTGDLQVRIDSFVAAVIGVIVAQASIGKTYVAGETWKLRVQTQGTSPTAVRMKAWKTSDPEPGSWDATSTDSASALQVTGSPGVRMLPTYATTWTIDDYLVDDMAGGGDPGVAALLLGGL